MLGFAPFNRPVAKIFLGDVGSLPIGLLLGWCLLQLAYHGQFAAALLLPLYYLLDATLTLLRRMAKGEPFWAAHRSHFYQRATENGYTVLERRRRGVRAQRRARGPGHCVDQAWLIGGGPCMLSCRNHRGGTGDAQVLQRRRAAPNGRLKPALATPDANPRRGVTCGRQPVASGLGKVELHANRAGFDEFPCGR